MAINQVAAKLFQPLMLGGKKDPVQLLHRIVMAPVSRLRASETGVQTPLAAEYYAQRATPGGLLIAEATDISHTANGYFRTPGIYTKEQVEAWKPITKAIHDKKAKMFVLLAHTGRVSRSSYHINGDLAVSAGATSIPIDMAVGLLRAPLGRILNRPSRVIELDKIPALIKDYRQAALNAIEAGFDGVELDAAGGYLLEQFLCEGVNKRTDKYGGSIENCARLVFEVLDAITSVVSQSKVGIRLAPFNDMLGCEDLTTKETYSYVIKQLNNKYDLSYLQIVEPQNKGYKVQESSVTALVRPIYDKVLFMSSRSDRQKVIDAVEDGKADAVAIGHDFIANPDLVKRLAQDMPTALYKGTTVFLARGDISRAAVGYTDYPTYEAKSKASELGHADT